MNTLIIVDCQNDFILDGAPLRVKGSTRAVCEIENLLDTGVIDNVVFTVDWHPSNHCSFKENGGEWPTHCVQYTEGASICDILYLKCAEKNIPYQVMEKGTIFNQEEYGAVSEIKDKRTYYELKSMTDTVFLNKRVNVIVCGVAGDYCVLETLKQLKPLCPMVYMKGIASIDGGEKLNTYINENNIKLW